MSDEEPKTYRYRAYYKNLPADHSKPFGYFMEPERVISALTHVASDIRHRLGDPAAAVESSTVKAGDVEVAVTIRTVLPAQAVRDAVAAALRSLGLLGDEEDPNHLAKR